MIKQPFYFSNRKLISQALALSHALEIKNKGIFSGQELMQALLRE